MKKARSLASRTAAVLNPDQSVLEAAVRMKQDDLGFLPVSVDGRLLGVLTDRDLVLRLAAEDRDPESTTIREIMSAPAAACLESDPLELAARLMAGLRLRRLPVLDRDLRIRGVLSLGRLAQETDRELALEVLRRVLG